MNNSTAKLFKAITTKLQTPTSAIAIEDGDELVARTDAGTYGLWIESELGFAAITLDGKPIRTALASEVGDIACDFIELVNAAC